jgi:hypothetical protein
MRPVKQCARCGGEYDADAFFRRISDRYIYPVCNGCEEQRRNNDKHKDRWQGKIRDTVRRHAAGFGLSVPGYRTHS